MVNLGRILVRHQLSHRIKGHSLSSSVWTNCLWTYITQRVNAGKNQDYTITVAQKRMKLCADKKRSEREFEVGDEVFLKLQPYRQTTVALKKQLKFSTKHFGPYKVLARVEKVAYKLALPPGAKIRPVFHVSLLKKKTGSKYFSSMDLPEFEDEVFKVYLVAILAKSHAMKMTKLGRPIKGQIELGKESTKSRENDGVLSKLGLDQKGKNQDKVTWIRDLKMSRPGDTWWSQMKSSWS
ncbi:UNVERIFIED_CONTAM: hypothetical protein Sradi_3792600 [Sesamum radiatum]|uniref:Tf2-1-like SH3-like domain-containing protein n=1 Tax=Sesamum radiatum TaxID=300843 RepID=A0AAW2Q0G4_SESRA